MLRKIEAVKSHRTRPGHVLRKYLEKAGGAGSSARRRGLSVHRNPHNANAEAYRVWRIGWEEQDMIIQATRECGPGRVKVWGLRNLY